MLLDVRIMSDKNKSKMPNKCIILIRLNHINIYSR